MRYFTKELWLSAQEVGQLEQYNRNWLRANDEYNAQLKKLEPRLNPDAYKFFLDADVHDGELLELVLEDGSRPAPLSQPVRAWKRATQHPVRAKLSVLAANDAVVWELSYASLRRMMVDFPTDPLFYSEGEGFGDWGYRELTDCGNGFLRHEVLFATGSVLLFEFKNITVKRSNRSSC
jgi:hypothetical protein